MGLAIPRTVYTPPSRSEPARKPAQTPRSAPKPPTPPAPEPVSTAPASEPNDASGSDIDISLQSVLNGLPADLKDRVRDLDIRGATMTISLERILTQLPSGSVKISFGSLRQAAPQLFSIGADCDSRDVALPLNEILAKVNPAMICPPAQPARGTVETETLTQAVPELETTRRTSTLSVPPVSAPGETVQPPQAIPTTPRKVTPKSTTKAARTRVPTPQAAKSSEESTRPAQSVPCINVDLASLIGHWPVEVQQEIAQWNLAEAKIALPADTVREGMKRGRVAFPWKTLRSWISPAPPAATSDQNNPKLELPLPVIAPLFLSGQKQPAKPGSTNRTPVAQTSTREEIPDLFFDAPKAQHSNGDNGHEAVSPTPSDIRPVELATPQPAVAEIRTAGGTSTLATSDAAVSLEVAPAQPAADQGVMRILLKDLTELWPENIRTEVAHWNLDQLMVALPADRINTALKQGKVIFSWENLRSWILPAPPSTTSLKDNALLELPLPVIMPIFLATRKQSPRQIAAPQIADDIPDPFADFLPPPAATPASQELKETPVSTAAKVTVADIKPKKADAPTATEKSPNTNFVSREQKSGDTGSRRRQQTETVAPASPTENPPTAQPPTSTPVEVLTTAMTLDGVAGALIALSDGFKVASKLPAGIDGDALAAFLPHIFSKVNQSTRELRMGDLNNLNFTVDNVPWKIFRVHQIFFAALGHAGKPMPTDQLATLAHKLTFKN